MTDENRRVKLTEITHRAFPKPTRRGNLTGRNCPMERMAQEEMKAHLMSTNEEFRQLAQQHSEYARKLDVLEALPHLTDEEQLEEHRLKKIKLRLKDQMEAIVSQHRTQQVA
jgi:uncharacterized protein